MEGSEDMSDLVLGMIIGGLIGVVGSAITAVIHGHYSLKTRREDILAQHQQQSLQIQHEKDTQRLSRLIARRSLYLEPLSTDLCSLSIAVSNYMSQLLTVLTPYYVSQKTDEIKVPKVAREELTRQMVQIQTTYTDIFARRRKVADDSAAVASPALTDKLTVLYKALTAFYDTNIKTVKTLLDTTTDEDLVYDLRPEMQSIMTVTLFITTVHSCIDSLLTGVEEDAQ
jgi:hypothetical protein